MGEFSDRLHFVEINFPSKVGIEPEFFVKIDGKKIEGICGATVESRMQTGGGPYPRVTISFWAKNVKGNIEGEVKRSPDTFGRQPGRSKLVWDKEKQEIVSVPLAGQEEGSK